MTRYVRRADTTATPLPGGDTAVLDLGSQNYFTLNETGAWLWERLEAPASAEALAEALAEVYDVGPEMARASVEALLDELVREGLVVST